MGFNKRFVDIETVNTYLSEEKNLDELFKSDALIFMDKMSSEVYNWHCNNLTRDEIKTILSENYDSRTI